MQLAHSFPEVPVGQIRSFGALGPKYEVGRPVCELDDGDWLVRGTMVETGETADYRLSQLIDDPTAS